MTNTNPNEQRADYRKRRKTFLIIAVVFLVLLVLGPGNRMAWSGSFSMAEHELEFTRPDGTPIQGVELSVEDAIGEKAFYYPVNDYTPRVRLLSGKDGLLTFHHVQQGVEFSGTCRFLFFVLPVSGRCTSPEYFCRFTYRGAEVFRIKYSELNRAARTTDSALVKELKWRWPEGTPDRLSAEQITVHRGDEEETIQFPVIRRDVILTENGKY